MANKQWNIQKWLKIKEECNLFKIHFRAATMGETP